MARGRPALWSSLLGLPIAGAGLWLHFRGGALSSWGLPFVALGGFVIAVGVYVRFAAPAPPTLEEDEELVETRYPRQRAAAVKVILSTPFPLVAAFLLFFTRLPYVYPTAAFFVGLLLFSTGVLTYWRNTLTTYYLTDRRVISAYRFVSLNRTEIPLDRIRVIQERRSVVESLVGLGSVRVAAGSGGGLEIVTGNVRDPGPFADRVRELAGASVPNRYSAPRRA